MVGNRPPCLGSPMSYLTVLLQGCYQVLERCKKTYFKAVLSTLESPQDSVSGRRQHRFDDRNAPRCCGVGVRVSAPLRRGAAPYGDGSLCSQAPSHLISLSILGVPEEFRPEFYKEFCVRHNGAKSPSWSLCAPLAPQSALFKGIWPPHTRRPRPPVGTPGL